MLLAGTRVRKATELSDLGHHAAGQGQRVLASSAGAQHHCQQLAVRQAIYPPFSHFFRAVDRPESRPQTCSCWWGQHVSCRKRGWLLVNPASQLYLSQQMSSFRTLLCYRPGAF